MQGNRVIVSVAAVAVVSATLLFHEPAMLAAGDFLVVQDHLESSDVIVVIAGPDDRADYGIQLYVEGYGKRLFFTGGWCPQHEVVHAEHGRDLALALGVPAQDIAIDELKITSTYSEALRLESFVTQSPVPIGSVIVVSDPHHMRRARWTYRRVLGEGIRVQMAPVPFELSPYKRRWWTDSETEQLVKSEYLKMAYYFARYQLGWGPVRDWLASLDRE